MALISCSNCWRPVSNQASICPHCGAPLRTAAPQAPATKPSPEPLAEGSSVGAPPDGGVNGSQTCPRCGQPVPAGNKFCIHCGAKLAPQPKFCIRCGGPLSPGVKFCRQCGSPVNGEAQASPPPSQPQPQPATNPLPEPLAEGSGVGASPAGGVAGSQTCPHCGQAVSAGNKFCIHCGAKLAPQPKFCIRCGGPLNHGVKFCRQCGSPVNGEAQASPPPSQPQPQPAQGQHPAQPPQQEPESPADASALPSQQVDSEEEWPLVGSATPLIDVPEQPQAPEEWDNDLDTNDNTDFETMPRNDYGSESSEAEPQYTTNAADIPQSDDSDYDEQEEHPKSGKTPIIGIVAATVCLLGIGVGAYFLLTTRGDTPTEAPQQATEMTNTVTDMLIYIDNSRATYSGMVLHDTETGNVLPNGTGKAVFDDGGVYEGSFVNGKMEGTGGNYKSKGFETDSLTMVDNAPQSGIMRWPDGSSFTGTFSNWNPSKGTFTDAQGRKRKL